MKTDDEMSQEELEFRLILYGPKLRPETRWEKVVSGSVVIIWILLVGVFLVLLSFP